MEKDPDLVALECGFILASSDNVYIDKDIDIFTMSYESRKKFADTCKFLYQITLNKYFKEVFKFFENFCTNNPIYRIKWAEIVYKNNPSVFQERLEEYKKELINDYYFVFSDRRIRGVTRNLPSDKKDIVYVDFDALEEVLYKYNISVRVHFPDNYTPDSTSFEYGKRYYST